jgi:hypothetical protein
MWRKCAARKPNASPIFRPPLDRGIAIISGQPRSSCDKRGQKSTDAVVLLRSNYIDDHYLGCVSWRPALISRVCGSSGSGCQHRGPCFGAGFGRWRFCNRGWRATNRSRGTISQCRVIDTSGSLDWHEFAGADRGFARAAAVENRPAPLVVESH